MNPKLCSSTVGDIEEGCCPLLDIAVKCNNCLNKFGQEDLNNCLNSGKLSTATIIGIVVGAVVFVILVAIVIRLVVKTRRGIEAKNKLSKLVKAGSSASRVIQNLQVGDIDSDVINDVIAKNQLVQS
jgi:hypothetical protein